MATAGALVAMACGGNPAGPSGEVKLHGTVVGATAAASGASAFAEHAASGRITVTVSEDPRLTTTVGGDGTFELEGMPEGHFTLVFTVNGQTLGTIGITGATAGEEIRITVQVTTTTVILIHIENGESGGTAGGEDGDDDDGGDDGDATRTCAISGGKVGEGIELEGRVASGHADGFELTVNGNRVKDGAKVQVTTAGASFKCNGKPSNSECRSTVKPSAQVHVSGRLESCDLSRAVVAAGEVKVQKP
jgi:hypothetical protein